MRWQTKLFYATLTYLFITLTPLLSGYAVGHVTTNDRSWYITFQVKHVTCAMKNKEINFEK